MPLARCGWLGMGKSLSFVRPDTITMRTDVNLEIDAALRMEAAASLPATALRTIARRFGLNRTDLAWVAIESYANMLTPEVQAIWHWDLDCSGRGHTDDELDHLLSHLVVRE